MLMYVVVCVWNVAVNRCFVFSVVLCSLYNDVTMFL